MSIELLILPKLSLPQIVVKRFAEINLRNYDIDKPLDLMNIRQKSTRGSFCETDLSYKHLQIVLVAEIYFAPRLLLSGKFTHRFLNWTVPEKELSLIPKLSFRSDFILETSRARVLLLTERNDLVHVSSSGAATKDAATKDEATKDTTIKKTYLGRLQQWSITTQSILFDATHMSGVINVFTNVLDRWGFLNDPIVTDDFIPSAVLESDLEHA